MDKKLEKAAIQGVLLTNPMAVLASLDGARTAVAMIELSAGDYPIFGQVEKVTVQIVSFDEPWLSAFLNYGAKEELICDAIFCFETNFSARNWRTFKNFKSTPTIVIERILNYE